MTWATFLPDNGSSFGFTMVTLLLPGFFHDIKTAYSISKLVHSLLANSSGNGAPSQLVAPLNPKGRSDQVGNKQPYNNKQQSTL